MAILLFLSCVFAVLSAFFSDMLQQVFAFSAAFFALLALFVSLGRKNNVKSGPAVNAAAKTVAAPVSSSSKSDMVSYEELSRDKMDVLNKFAAVASHDLKNPLSSMKNIAYYFSNSFKVEGEVPNKMLSMLSSEVERMNNMIVDLLDTTRVKQLSMVKTNLGDFLNKEIETAKTDGIAFEILAPQQVDAYVDPQRFSQVISSMLKNAKEAISDQPDGKISVKLSRDRENIIIEISDNGRGMNAETLKKCFDPMFTTKTAKALGMSLAVSKQIILMSDGKISAESKEGNGSKFKITLPAA